MIVPVDERAFLQDRIYRIHEDTFDSVSREVYAYQLAGNPLLREYAMLVSAGSSGRVFLPVSLFKSNDVQTGTWAPEKIFSSSGTSGQVPSRHLVRDLAWYHAMTRNCFPAAWGHPGEYTWIGLLPSYLERPDSSLVEMVRYFTACGQSPPLFYRKAEKGLTDQMTRLAGDRRRTILIGVSFALLDFFETIDVPLWPELLVIETGGMKGRGREMTREELYARVLARAPGLSLASEYGMTELFSQAYRIGGHYRPGPTMRVIARDINDPLQQLPPGQRGALNIIDLGNLDTCAFIATEDTGIVYADGSFEVFGRLEAAEQRGCNLMYTG